ncbi:MAG: 16S rRNA (guanine(527)-N(7))-methyltransferase RsmG [Oscillospiraceae bacterium]|nr:16S rRNA (guanine(527)-N(7))-methyltransferase RsmG [Oscillospiraceae bacterium]
MNNSDLLSGLIAPLRLEITRKETFERFELYCARLIEKNEVMNITTITDPVEIYTRHFADSLAPAAKLPRPGKTIDVGCGGGFPGLPLKIFYDDGAPDLVELTLLDSTAKKIDFLRELTAEMGLKNVSFDTRRAEDAARDAALREKFDMATSRAVTAMPALCELCLPFVKVGGIFAAHKSARAADEVDAGRRAAGTLGGSYGEFYTYSMGDVEAFIVPVTKKKPTPAEFPRPWAKIKKKPL